MFDLLSTLTRIATGRILVVGDLILDHYIKGSTERTSPEAPVPVVLYSGESHLPGGAANVARNIMASGAGVSCVGAVGDDSIGQELLSALRAANISDEGVVTDPYYTTVKKSRIVSQGQQVVRVDYERSPHLSPDVQQALGARIEKLAVGACAIIVSDYAKGVISQSVFRAAVEAANINNIPIFVDPKGKDFTRYRGATVLTPNIREAGEATGILFGADPEPGIVQAADAIRESTGCKWLVITRGADGLSVFDFERSKEAVKTVASSAREVFDVTGAGDTFIAWLTMGTCAGLTPQEAARLANTAAGIAVAHSGVAVVSPWQLRGALIPAGFGRKLVEPVDLKKLGNDLRSQNKKIVFTNGCFDFLHAGHVAFLQEARGFGDVLVVAMNDDAGIQRLKGPDRPIIRQQQREGLLASVEAVDYLVPFSEDTPRALLEALKPDVLIKGGNYEIGQVEGGDIVIANGGRVETIPIIHDFSTRMLAPMLKKKQ